MAGEGIKGRFRVLLDYFDSEEQELKNFFRSLKRNDDFLEKWKIMLRALIFMVVDLESKKWSQGWNRNSVRVVVDLGLLAAESQTKSSPVRIDAKEKERKMEEILYRIDGVLKQGDALDLSGGEEYDVYRMKLQKIRFNPIWDGESRRRFIYFVDESEVFGMDVKKEEFMNILLSDDTCNKELSVIPIQGQFGIGKTTLARIIYKDPIVGQHFDLKAWFRVGLNLDQLQLKLQEYLRGKRFLLVLDDVWSVNKDWEVFRSTLIGAAANKCCVIVTTRKEDYASLISTVNAYQMEPLLYDESWSLFAKFAFGNQIPSSYPDLEPIGREIVRSCDGVPSTVRTLGSLLRFKLQVEDWKTVQQTLVTSLFYDKRIPDDDLPTNLKQCLRYYSLFSNDYEFKKENLDLLWMAEGLLDGQRMENTGYVYFDQLFSKKHFSSCSARDGDDTLLKMFNEKEDQANIIPE
uniref:NB-ARC domain-containing protein n=1 Tax=Quercus lobata TaxID=97700 RepID=A0A7N2R2G0_QUELO